MAALADADAPIMAAVVAGTRQSSALFQSKLRMCHEVIVMDSQSAGVAKVARVPKKAVIHDFLIWQTAAVTTTTFALGISGTVEKYVAAAVADVRVPTSLIQKISVFGVELAAEEDILLTTATTDLPAAGELHLITRYTTKE